MNPSTSTPRPSASEIPLDHARHVIRQRGHVFRQRVGQCLAHRVPHHGPVGNGLQCVGGVLRVVAPRPRIHNAVLHRSVHRDQVPAVTEQQSVFVGSVLDRPEHVFRSSCFLTFVADLQCQDSLDRNAKHAIDRPRPMQMKSRLEWLALHRNAQVFDEALLL